jgi:hypothetical protein
LAGCSSVAVGVACAVDAVGAGVAVGGTAVAVLAGGDVATTTGVDVEVGCCPQAAMPAVSVSNATMRGKWR